MKRGTSNFKEVALSFTAPGCVLNADEGVESGSPARLIVKPSGEKQRSQGGFLGLLRQRMRRRPSEESVDMESEDMNPSRIDKRSPLLKRLIPFKLRSPSHSFSGSTYSRRSSQYPGQSPSVALAKRVNGWSEALRKALEVDRKGNRDDAIQEYERLNRQMTKEAIYTYERLTSDQQKLFGHVLAYIDIRTQQLKQEKESSENGSVLLEPEQQSSLVDSSTLHNLCKCLEIFESIKALSSHQKVSVVLVYKERKHRKHHRYGDKGNSNRILFPKEKRDFLQIMGLPGSMVTAQGLDFSVKPVIDLETGLPIRVASTSSSNQKSMEEEQEDKTNGDVAETKKCDAKDEEEDIESRNESIRILSSVVRSVSQQFARRLSISPKSYQGGSNDSQSKEEEEDDKSFLSCDTCSTDEVFNSEEESDEGTDVAVTSSEYGHQDTILEQPTRIGDKLYLSLIFDKIGVRDSSMLTQPHMRITIKDKNGEPVEGEPPQETSVWETANRHYLQAPSSEFFLQNTLEYFSEDMAIFFELRHLRSDKNNIVTHCYTFLEGADLQTGTFVCELYKPPVDYTGTNYISYSEKAFFLHMEVKIDNEEE